MFNKVSFLDKLFFTKHLSIMLKSGIPLSEILDGLREEARSAAFKKILTGVYNDAQCGKSLEESLAKYPQAFDKLYLSLIKIGERSGNLEKNLTYLSEQLDKENSFKKKIQSAMLYPLLVLTATIGLGGAIAFFILPQLVDFFEGLNVELPLTTKILLFFGSTMRDYALLIILGLIGFFILFLTIIRMPSIRPSWQRLLLHLPFLGVFLKSSDLASFSRNLGIMLQSSIPIAQALTISAEAMGNEVFKTDIKKIGQAVEEGKSIEEVLRKEKFFEFPSIMVKMIGVGERTGHLEENLLYLADFFEEEVDSLSKNLTNILEPALLLGIGLMVAFVALAIISPIYELTGSVR